MLNGQIKFADSQTVNDTELALLDFQGDVIQFKTSMSTKLLLLAGEPLNEPIVGYGPFVMNTRLEINQAIVDYKNGKMGNPEIVEGSES